MNSSVQLAVALSLVLGCTNIMAAGSFTKVPKLEIKPITCIVKQLGELCTMTVKVNWQATQPVDACLYQEEMKIRCWHAKQSITEKLDISLQKNMTFRLIDSEQVVLAQQVIKVNAAMSSQYRRRLKTDWSIF
ncbi:DUF3019 domain-containing protein [Pseudoalteromonas sp. MMG022]|uniref:DUF3019 domain-containing protein n=1 Tax=Pseudoalteromonas sp. MMG022 TaxID=2909978 RepID=UPI001F34029F|nr:DUF3019 domain-containing protein [Pseudoalteromonas sp. MMG022]MCF6434469.1 DUF3019 domain-containing protein [Pseudoalteromonas sp. MMG022]